MKKAITKMSSLINKMTRLVSERKNGKKVFAENLPMESKFFVMNNFPNKSIAFAAQRITLTGKTYEATLNNGAQVEFNENGSWRTVDCNMDAVPSTLVPSAISKFMDSHYPNTPLVRIEKVGDGYEVTLFNYATLRFKNLENVL